MSQTLQNETLQPAAALWTIDQLNETAKTSEEYFKQLLTLLMQHVGASTGHIWQSGEQGLQSMMESVSESDKSDEVMGQVRSLVSEVFKTRHSRYQQIPTGEGLPACAPPRCGLCVPLFNHADCIGLASVVTRASDEYEAANHLSFLEMAADRVRRGYVLRHYSLAADELVVNAKAQQVYTNIGRHLDAKPLAAEVVNRLQKYFEVDRTALAFKRGKKCSIKGVSNQAVFERRSNVIRGLEKLSAHVAKIEEPLWYPAQAEELAPSLRVAVDKYLDVSNGLSIGLIPVFSEPKRRDDPEDIAATIKSDDQRRECVAVLTVERMDEPLDVNKVQRRWERVAAPVSNAIANSRKYDGLFLMPVWRSLAQFADLYRGHTQRKALLITGGILLAIACLFLVRGNFKLRGDGEIRPVSRQHVFAQSEGIVEQLMFAVGNPVHRGDVLVQLKNPELATQMADVEGRLREAEKQLETLTIQRVTQSYETEQEERELIRQAVSTEARVAGLQEQLDVLHERERQLLVVSPMDGQVVTWDSDQRLKDRPVERGDRLFTIVLPEGAWEIELRIPDKRSGYLLRKWQEAKVQGQPMKVSFVIASNATAVFEGVVSDVSPGSNVDERANENVVRVSVEIPPEEFSKIKHVMPGTTVIGHVHVGRASIAYCKLYEFFDWTQRMWFKFVS